MAEPTINLIHYQWLSIRMHIKSRRRLNRTHQCFICICEGHFRKYTQFRPMHMFGIIHRHCLKKVSKNLKYTTSLLVVTVKNAAIQFGWLTLRIDKIINCSSGFRVKFVKNLWNFLNFSCSCSIIETVFRSFNYESQAYCFMHLVFYISIQGIRIYLDWKITEKHLTANPNTHIHGKNKKSPFLIPPFPRWIEILASVITFLWSPFPK